MKAFRLSTLTLYQQAADGQQHSRTCSRLCPQSLCFQDSKLRSQTSKVNPQPLHDAVIAAYIKRISYAKQTLGISFPPSRGKRHKSPGLALQVRLAKVILSKSPFQAKTTFILLDQVETSNHSAARGYYMICPPNAAPKAGNVYR